MQTAGSKGKVTLRVRRQDDGIIFCFCIIKFSPQFQKYFLNECFTLY